MFTSSLGRGQERLQWVTAPGVLPFPHGKFYGQQSGQLWRQAAVPEWMPFSLKPAPKTQALELIGSLSWQQGPIHLVVGCPGKGWDCSAISRTFKAMAHSSTLGLSAGAPQYWGTITAANWPIKP